MMDTKPTKVNHKTSNTFTMSTNDSDDRKGELQKEAPEQNMSSNETIRFNKPFYALPVLTILHFMKSFWIDGISNTIAILAGQIGMTIIFSLTAKSGDVTLLASLGISVSCYFLIFNAIKDRYYISSKNHAHPS